MKKIAKSLLVFVCLIASQMAWAHTPNSEMNIYATGLNTEGTIDRNTRQVTIEFVLASPGKGVWVYVDTDNYGDYETQVYANNDLVLNRDKVTKLTFNLPNDEYFQGGTYNWAVKVKGAPKDTEYEGTTNGGKSYGFNTGNTPLLARDFENSDYRYKFQYPKGLTINTNHNSEYCGYVYLGEAGKLSNLTLTDKRPIRLGSSQGIYVFKPNLAKIWSSGDDILSSAPYGAFTGGNIEWWTNETNKYYGPYRLSVDKDDYVYVCQNHPTEKTENGVGVEKVDRIWRVHASKLNTGNPSTAFDCIMTTTTLNNAGLPKRVLAMSTGYIDSDKYLYVISGYTSGGIISSASLSCWKITETGNGNCAIEFCKSKSLTEISYKTNKQPQKLSSPHCSVVPGNNNGDLWIFQQADNNSTTGDQIFSAIHFDKDWTADYKIASNGAGHYNRSGCGAVGKKVSQDNDQDRINSGKSLNFYYLAMPSAPKNDGTDNSQVLKVFHVYINDDKSISDRMEKHTIYNPKSGDGFGANGLDATAIDLADNLYFTSSNKNLLYVYSLPNKEMEHITPAPSSAALNVPYTVTWNRNGITEDYTNATTYNYMYSSDFVPTLGKEGYKFHGWYEDPNFSGTPVTSINKNTTLHARWTKLEIYEDNATANQTVLEDDVNGYHGSVWVYRKLQGEMFSTLCLPFDITTDILNKATNSAKTSNPLSGATLWTFSRVSTEGDGTKILHFKPTDTVTANTPFLIEPTDDIAEEIFFHGVTISKPTNYQAAGTVTHDGITFTGVINPVELAAGSNTFFLVSDNRLAIPAAGGATLGGLRGYFTNPSGARLAIRTQQNTPTLLESVNCNIKNTYKILQDGKIYIIRDGVMYDIKGYRL